MIAIALVVGVVLGAGGYYAADRITFLWGSTIRDMRHAGWTAKRRTS